MAKLVEAEVKVTGNWYQTISTIQSFGKCGTNNHIVGEEIQILLPED